MQMVLPLLCFKTIYSLYGFTVSFHLIVYLQVSSVEKARLIYLFCLLPAQQVQPQLGKQGQMQWCCLDCAHDSQIYDFAHVLLQQTQINQRITRRRLGYGFFLLKVCAKQLRKFKKKIAKNLMLNNRAISEKSLQKINALKNVHILKENVLRLFNQRITRRRLCQGLFLQKFYAQQLWNFKQKSLLKNFMRTKMCIF